MKYKVTENITIMELLIQLFPDSPHTRVKKMLGSGRISVNGRVVTHFATALKPGDEVESASFVNTKKDSAPFKILFEDEHFVAIDKPAGINTSSADDAPSCSAILSDWYKDNSKGHIRVFVVHRLDKEVSGVLLFSKSEKAMEQLRDNWDKTEKRYIAVVEGMPKPPEGIKESWLMEDENQRMYSVKSEVPGAKFARTEYRTVKTIDNYTVLEIILHTGRKNQIRVHMRDLGCPVVGDRRYGADSKYNRRVRLHSIYLSFPHPVTGRSVVIKSQPPKSFYNIKPENEIYK